MYGTWVRKSTINLTIIFRYILQECDFKSLEFYPSNIECPSPPIYLHWDFRYLEKNTVWTGKNNQFVFKLGKKIPVWNIKLAKSKIPVRVVKNVISKWTKIWFPSFQFLWFTAVGVVNPPDQKLIMYISVNCKKGMNSWARSIKIFYPSSETWKKIQFELVKITSLFSN